MSATLPIKVNKYPYRTVMAYNAYKMNYQFPSSKIISLFCPVTTAAAKIMNFKCVCNTSSLSLFCNIDNTNNLNFNTILYYEYINGGKLFDSHLNCYFINDEYEHEEVIVPSEIVRPELISKKKKEGFYINIISNDNINNFNLFIVLEDLDISRIINLI